jgi:transposase
MIVSTKRAGWTRTMMRVGTGEGGSDDGGRRRGRRSWTIEEKKRIVAETDEPGASVSVVARRHDLNANQLFTWRRQVRDARLMTTAPEISFTPAVITTEAPASLLAAQPACAAGAAISPVASSPIAAAGRMEIVLAGGARVLVDQDVNAMALARVIGVLERR